MQLSGMCIINTAHLMMSHLNLSFNYIFKIVKFYYDTSSTMHSFIGFQKCLILLMKTCRKDFRYAQWIKGIYKDRKIRYHILHLRWWRLEHIICIFSVYFDIKWRIQHTLNVYYIVNEIIKQLHIVCCSFILRQSSNWLRNWIMNNFQRKHDVTYVTYTSTNT